MWAYSSRTLGKGQDGGTVEILLESWPYLFPDLAVARGRLGCAIVLRLLTWEWGKGSESESVVCVRKRG